MKVENMTSPKGNKVPNQFIIENCNGETWFQSYNSMIAKLYIDPAGQKHVHLDKTYWDYSVTTRKYRNIFLGETKKETQAKIDSGEYVLTDLN